MPYYDNDTIEEVRSRNDIVDVISQYVHLQKKGSSDRRSRCIIVLAVVLAAMSLRF